MLLESIDQLVIEVGMEKLFHFTALPKMVTLSIHRNNRLRKISLSRRNPLYPNDFMPNKLSPFQNFLKSCLSIDGYLVHSPPSENFRQERINCL